MKVKYSVIPFIPVAIAMIGIKIMSLFSLDSNGLLFSMNKSTINYLVIGLSLALFVLCVLFNLFDRKTAPVYKVKKNYAAGVFAVLSGVAVASASLLEVMNSVPSNTDSYFMSLIVAVFSIPAAIAFILMSKVHFTGKSTISGVSTLFIFPALWGCSELVAEFLKATKVSLSASDMTPLFCYIFITLYFFSHAMIISRIKGRNPVKACFIYGLPCVAISLAYGAYVICTSTIENTGISSIVLGAQFITLALYAVSFIIEMFFGTLTKDEVEIIDSLPEEEDTYENSYISSGGYDELLISRKYDEEQKSPEKFTPDLSGLDDFVMGYTEDETNDIVYRDKKIKTDDDIIFSTDTDKEQANVENATEEVTAETTEVTKEEPIQESAQEESKPEVVVAPKQEENPVPQPVAKPEPEADLSADDIISSERLSEIDKLLEELENKKK